MRGMPQHPHARSDLRRTNDLAQELNGSWEIQFGTWGSIFPCTMIPNLLDCLVLYVRVVICCYSSSGWRIIIR